MDCYNTTTGTKTYWRNRAASEERPTTIKAFETNNTNNTSAGTPLLGRKIKQVKIKKFSANLQSMNQVHQQQPLTDHPGLYDRKLNRSFEKPEGFVRKVETGYPTDEYYVSTSAGSNPVTNNNSNSSPLRRSTPHLAADEYYLDPDFRNSIAPASWCCGVMKQLRKMNLQY